MIKVISYGGGVQSTALLALAAQGQIDYKTFLFCNVGNDSEHPETLKYVHEIAMPYAKEHGIELIELQKHLKDGSVDTVYQRLTRPNSKSIGIPVRMSNGTPGNRTCTIDFKIEIVDKWLKAQGAKQHGATVALGISLDEWHRMRTDSGLPWKRLAYPLIDLRLDRSQCTEIIRQAGLPIPPKSSCWFCPFHSLRVWQGMRNTEPELFQRACELEQLINERRATIGKNQVWLTDKLKPLGQVTTDLIQGDLFAEDEQVCESGYCMV